MEDKSVYYCGEDEEYRKTDECRGKREVQRKIRHDEAKMSS
jgi:hypothetical protein